MKKLTITALVGALLVLAGCIQAELDPLPEEDGIRITLNCGEIGTRTDYPEELEGEANENLINSVDYFLFSSNNQRSIYSGHLEPKVAGDFTFYIKTTVAGVNTGTTYTVFTIVNLPESKRIGSVVNDKFVWNLLSRSDLDQILLDEATDPTFTSVTTNGSDSQYEPAGKDLSLVMTGESVPFTVSDLQEATTVPVNLERLPAKVTMEFFIKDRIVRNEKGVTETWTPMTSGANVRAYLCNGAKSIQVGGSAAQDPDRIFSYQPSVDNVAISSDKEGYSKAFRSEAFYSYPRQWSQGDKDEPFLKLIIPWKVRRVVDGVTTESQKEFYYKVMLPSELAGTGNDKGFVKNHWYRLIVDVDRLGSATDDAAVTVPCEYAVLDWGNLQDFNLNMVQALYLDVNEGKYEVEFYGDKLELPFFSSGSVSYKIDNAYYNVFRTEGEYAYARNNTSVSPAAITSSTPISEWQEIDRETVYVYTRLTSTAARRCEPERIESRSAINSWNLDKRVYKYTCSGQPDILTTTQRNWSQSTSNSKYYFSITDEDGNPVTIESSVPQTSYSLSSTKYYFDKEDVDGEPIIITYTYSSTQSNVNTIKGYYSGGSTTAYLYNANGQEIRITGGNKNNYSLDNNNTHINYETGDPHDFTGYDVSVSNEEKFLSIDHELKVNYSTRSYDISPYIYEITLMLDGHEGEFDKKLKVTQYPSLYLNKVRSGDYPSNAPSSTLTGAETVFVNTFSYSQTGTGLTPAGSHYLFVNGHSTSFNASQIEQFIGTLVSSSSIDNSGSNTNQYIFEVNATILQNFALEINGASVDAVIGDPRVPEGTTNYQLPNGSSFSFDINGLQQYRPTANNTKEVISPRFRVASSFGRTYATTYQGAMRRCAAYQENGYPAGRWRLPTMAEIQFIMRLYGDQKIDMLFDPDNTSAYWAGGGMARFGKGFILGDEVFVDMYSDTHISNDSPKMPSAGSVRYDFSKTENGETTTSRVGVWTRCVYDTWYWGDGQYGNYRSDQPSWLGFQTAAPSQN